jgi:BirA family biotin operon repressor/biotin-[acetyl-CoA-carboxylase] ligase
MKIGSKIIHLESVDSTNNYAANLVQKGGCANGTVIMAEKQYAGRGQAENLWQSEAGKNLTFSILLMPSFLAVDRQFDLNKAISIALNDVLTNYIPASAFIKWPNDLVVGGAKLSGLLLEATQLADGHMACVIGIGLNVESHPPDLPYAATSLRELGSEARAELALERIRAHMSVWLSRWQRGENFAAIREAWMAHAAALDQRVDVQMSGGTRTGIFRGLDATGQMILETEAGRELIAAGDMFLG